MDIQKRELWHRLENEPERAYRAFECFLNLPSGERTLLGAYRRHVDNADAMKTSDTWSRWSSQFAWRERAAAFDDHLASVRREAFEQTIKEEAAQQAREVERARYRSNELLALGYERAAQWLEDAERSDLRFQDVLNLTRLYMDYLTTFDTQPASRAEDDWSEEDLAAGEQIMKEIEEREDPEEEDML